MVKNRQGLWMEIVAYHNRHDMEVRIVETGEIIQHVRYDRFKAGKVDADLEAYCAPLAPPCLQRCCVVPRYHRTCGPNRRQMLRAVIVILSVVALASCRSVRYVPVESVRVDSVVITKLRVDTLREKENTIIERKGDTIFHTTIVERERVSEKTDTLYKLRYVKVPVPYEVTKQPSLWQQIKSGAVGAATMLVLCGCGFIEYKIKK